MTGRAHAFLATGHAHGRRIAAGVVARPVHAVVLALVLGLLTEPRLPGLAVSLAAALVTGATARGAWAVRRSRRTPDDAALHQIALDGHDPRRAVGLGLLAGVAILVGAVVADARVASLERSRLAPDLGRSVSERVVVEDAPRTSRFGGWSAMVELRGEPVLLRVAQDAPGGRPDVGTVLAVDGRLRAPGAFAVQRHAHAELRTAAAAVAGQRGGVSGALDDVRRRAEAALDRGLPPAAAGLLRGMVLGQDDALPDHTREDFRAAGLSHLVRSAA